ncbi:integrase, partial [bacterium]|nr:integrase [bacterium]
VCEVFRYLRKQIGLDKDPPRSRPRIHDLRHTFAVCSLEKCPEGRDNVGKHTLALSTYLGHTHVSDTYWYLEATPQLMIDISGVAEKYMLGGYQS